MKKKKNLKEVKKFEEYINEEKSIVEIDPKIKQAALHIGLDLTKNLSNSIDVI